MKVPTRKRALLLYSAGEEVADIFETLPDQGEEKEYGKTVMALNAYFQSKVNKTYESTNEEYTYRFTLHSVRDKAHPLTEVIIEGKTVKCLIDSGAGVNVIDTYTFNQMENVHISPTSKKIYGYRSTEPLPVVGTFEASIKSGVTNKFKITQFCAVDKQDGNLIS